METQGQIVSPITITPVNVTGQATGQAVQQQSMEQVIQDTAKAMQRSLDSFDAGSGCGADSNAQQMSAEDQQKVEEAKGIFKRFSNMITSQSFHDEVCKQAKIYKVPPKAVAEGIFSSILGTIGDIAGIAVRTAGNGAHTVIDLLATVLHGTVNVIVSVADWIVRTFTLNKTCIKPCRA